MNSRISLKQAMVVTGALVLSACATPSPNYYALTPHVAPLTSSPVQVIEVSPVGLPDRLDRTQMVLEDTHGQSDVLDLSRWTSSLSAELHDALSAGLQQKLGAVDRYNSGMTGGKVAYRIAADFARFDIIEHTTDTAEGPHVAVAVSWIIKRDDPALPAINPDKSLPAPDRQVSCRMAFNIPIDKGSWRVDGAVGASRIAVNHVVDVVAASVVAMAGNTTAAGEASCS